MKERALFLLINRPRHITYPIISENTGLTTYWLKLFRSGKINDPKVSKIEKLISFLELKVKND